MNVTSGQPAPPKAQDGKLARWRSSRCCAPCSSRASVLGYLGWTSTDTSVPASGYVALVLGVVFSLVVGVGLMALVFYSSRKGYDEPVVLIREPESDADDGQSGPR